MSFRWSHGIHNGWWDLIVSRNTFNTLRPKQNGRRFTDDVFKCIFLNENVWILIKISLKYVPLSPINNILALVQVMAWRQSGDKPLSEPMMVRIPMHIWVTRLQWVKNPMMHWRELSCLPHGNKGILALVITHLANIVVINHGVYPICYH